MFVLWLDACALVSGIDADPDGTDGDGRIGVVVSGFAAAAAAAAAAANGVGGGVAFVSEWGMGGCSICILAWSTFKGYTSSSNLDKFGFDRSCLLPLLLLLPAERLLET
eukprot:gene28154-16802_t